MDNKKNNEDWAKIIMNDWDYEKHKRKIREGDLLILDDYKPLLPPSKVNKKNFDLFKKFNYKEH